MSTLDNLEDHLNEDLAWRRTELHSLLAQIRSTAGPAQKCLCRASVALLYAHWEGYTKLALTRYLKYVAKRKLLAKELKPCFVARALESLLRKKIGMSAALISVERAEWLLSNGDTRVHIPSTDEIDTQSNLNSDVCADLFVSLGLDLGPLQTKSMLMDYNLLRARNHVAHGEQLSIEKGDYEELHHEVLGMIESVKRVIITAAENKQYRRDNPMTIVATRSSH